MKTIRIVAFFIALLFPFAFIACDQVAKDEKAKEEQMIKESFSSPRDAGLGDRLGKDLRKAYGPSSPAEK